MTAPVNKSGGDSLLVTLGKNVVKAVVWLGKKIAHLPASIGKRISNLFQEKVATPAAKQEEPIKTSTPKGKLPDPLAKEFKEQKRLENAKIYEDPVDTPNAAKVVSDRLKDILSENPAKTYEGKLFKDK